MRFTQLRSKQKSVETVLGKRVCTSSGGRQDSSDVAVQMFVQPHCAVGLGSVATPQQQTLLGEVFNDRSTIYSPV